MAIKTKLLTVLCLAASLWLNGYQILSENSKTKSLGYGDWYIEKNGELSLMQQILRPGSLVIDAGANVGEWSFNAVNTQADIKIYAFEPIPPVFERLKANLPFQNITFSDYALSDKEGPCNFYYYNDTPSVSALSGFYQREVLKGDLKDPQLIEVEQITLTKFCADNGITYIDFLKIDTEGAEWKVLKGAEPLLNNHSIGVIQFEYGGCYKDAMTTLEQVYRLLSKNGYLVFRIIPNGLIHIQKWQPHLENYDLCNYCAVHKTKFAEFFSGK